MEREKFLPQYEDEKIDEIVLRAVEMPSFQEIVQKYKNLPEKITAVRKELRETFPEINDIPEPKPGGYQRPIMGLASNEFIIAKKIVELLWDKK